MKKKILNYQTSQICQKNLTVWGGRAKASLPSPSDAHERMIFCIYNGPRILDWLLGISTFHCEEMKPSCAVFTASVKHFRFNRKKHIGVINIGLKEL